jgi:hypothetical protein
MRLIALTSIKDINFNKRLFKSEKLILFNNVILYLKAKELKTIIKDKVNLLNKN